MAKIGNTYTQHELQEMKLCARRVVEQKKMARAFKLLRGPQGQNRQNVEHMITEKLSRANTGIETSCK